jgi:hypothetical protein
LRVDFDEHGSGIVDQEAGFHDIPVVFDDILLLKVEDVPAFANSLKFTAVVYPAIAKLEVNCVGGDLQERHLRTVRKY